MRRPGTIRAREAPELRSLGRSALLGAATGMRSMAAPSQLSRSLSVCSPRPADAAMTRILRRPAVAAALQVAAVGEMVVDKLPIVPDRISPGPLFGRLMIGAMAGSVGAGTNGRSRAAGALLGGIGAVIGAYLGFHARRALTRRAGLPDLPVALAEDALAIQLARTAISSSHTA